MKLDSLNGNSIPVKPASVDFAALNKPTESRFLKFANSSKPTNLAREQFGCANCAGAKFSSEKKLEITPGFTFDQTGILTMSLTAYCQVAEHIQFLRQAYSEDAGVKKATLACQHRPRALANFTFKS